MCKMGIHNRWVQRVMCCIRTVSYRIIVNGVPQGKFMPQRGLRQGDPLSPYLFILVKVLPLKIKEAMDYGVLQGLKIKRQCPLLSSFFFAYDAMFFGEATEINCRRFMDCVEKYCNASGQLINFGKSTVCFSKKMLCYQTKWL